MSKPVTSGEAKEFLRLFEKHGSYAAVARITGHSASTIRKYIRTAETAKVPGHPAEQKDKKE